MLPSVCSRALHEVEGESWEERHLLEGANEVMFWYKPARCSFFLFLSSTLNPPPPGGGHISLRWLQ
jgi:hypothetical protein